MHERDLFIAAIEIEDESARRAYLDSACAGDSALRVRVERLLNRDAQAGDFLEQPAADLCADADEELLTEAGEPEQLVGDPPTMLGKADDTGQTVLVNPSVSAATATSSKLASAPQGKLTKSSAIFGTLFGRYRVDRVLGSGGMGVVYLAEDLRLGRRVALKIPKFDADANGTFHLTERFRREARTMASVLHRNLCPIFDVDEQDGTHYLTMAFIDGETLAEVRKKGSSFTARQIAELIRKLALALDEAHRAGVIHRDLKPANVMLDRSGEPILMDFGLAWIAHESDSRVTQSGAIVGTPAYMSPEQAEGDADKIGAASDIYSLGAILYELLAGRPIHTGSVTRVLFKLMHEAPTLPSKIHGDVDPRLEEICLKAIARRPEDRFATAAEFADALARFDKREGEAVTEPQMGERYGSTAATPSRCRIVLSDKTEVLPQDSSTETIVYSSPQADRRNKSRAVLASLLVISVIGAVWAIVANRAKPIREDNPLRQSDAAKRVNLGSQLEPTDWKPLFNRRDLTGWGAPQGKGNWEVKDGVLTGTVAAGDSGLMPFVGRTFENFELRIEVRLLRGTANSGVYLDSVQPNVSRYQVEISPSDTEFSTGSIAQSGIWKWLDTKRHRLAPDGEWNELVVIADGSQLVSRVNGQPVASISDAASNQTKTLTLELDGRAGAGAIEFRKIEVREIGPKPAPYAPPPAKAPFDPQQARAHQEAWAKHLGTPIEVINEVGAKMILIPPGEFRMGSTDEQVAAAAKTADEINAEAVTKDRISKVERPQHPVVITKPFYFGATEVTIAQFKKFSATGYRTEAEKLVKDATSETYLTPGYAVTDESPAAVITWNDAVAYCRWLSDTEKVTYRLPTEAEWEYACRAGTTTQFSFGDDHQELDQFGWFKTNSESRSHEVGQKRPNAFGLHDMHGNLWEWCHDFYDEKWYEKSPTNDPTGPLSGTQYVIRGGYWPSSASTNRSAHRGRTIASNRSNHFGFRVVRELMTVSRSQVLSHAPLKLELAEQLPSVKLAAGLKLGDLDGDGDLDLFVAMLRAPCVVLRNDGRGHFTDSGQQLGNNNSFAVALGDFDGDGDLDAFVCNSDDQANAIWLNNGRGTFQPSEQLFPPPALQRCGAG